MLDGGDFLLQRLETGDAYDLNRLMSTNNERFRRFFPGTLSQNLSVTGSQRYIQDKQRLLDNREEYTLGLRDKASNTVVGLIILKDIHWDEKRGELAYCISPDFGGRSWTSRAVSLFCEYAINNLGLVDLRIMVHQSNVPSVRVAEKSGFTWVKTMTGSFTPPGESPLNMEFYQRTQ